MPPEQLALPACLPAQDLGRVRDFYVTGIEAVRLVRPAMPIIIHDSFRGPMWATLLKNFPYKNVVMVRETRCREDRGHATGRAPAGVQEAEAAAAAAAGG